MVHQYSVQRKRGKNNKEKDVKNVINETRKKAKNQIQDSQKAIRNRRPSQDDCIQEQ